jgi:hypothetical protein
MIKGQLDTYAFFRSGDMFSKALRVILEPRPRPGPLFIFATKL